MCVCVYTLKEMPNLQNKIIYLSWHGVFPPKVGDKSISYIPLFNLIWIE